MRTSICSLLLLGGLTAGAWAQPQIAGNVYQVVPQGVYIQNSNGISFVPSASASFKIGNTAVNLSTLQVGAPVNAYYPGYHPQYVPVEYVQQHPNWDWNHHLNGWQQDRKHWHHDNGRWHNEEKWEKKHGRDGDGDDHGHGKKHKKDHGRHGHDDD